MRLGRTRGVATSIIVVLAAMTMAPLVAHADPTPDKDSCIAAHEKAQVERRAHRLVSAKSSLLYCSQRACPSIARHDCTTWLGEVEVQLPTVIFEARAEGRAVHDVKVSVDGTDLLDHVEDSAQVPLDPGSHQIKFERSGSKPVQQDIKIVTGEKGRRVAVVLEPDPSPATSSSDPDKRPLSLESGQKKNEIVPPVVYVLGGVAVVSFTSFAIFGLRGLAYESELESKCSPGCSAEQIAYADTQYLVADVSLVIGILSAGAAGWLFFSRGNR